jgi:hypothetical protein
MITQVTRLICDEAHMLRILPAPEMKAPLPRGRCAQKVGGVTIHYTVYCILHVVHMIYDILYTMNYVLYAVHYALYTIYHALYTMCFILCTV